MPDCAFESWRLELSNARSILIIGAFPTFLRLTQNMTKRFRSASCCHFSKILHVSCYFVSTLEMWEMHRWSILKVRLKVQDVSFLTHNQACSTLTLLSMCATMNNQAQACPDHKAFVKEMQRNGASKFQHLVKNTADLWPPVYFAILEIWPIHKSRFASN